MRRASGSLFGLAYGDAIGRPTEFLTVAEIIDRYGEAGPRDLAGDPALVTDDTQMALAVAWALLDAGRPTGHDHADDGAHRGWVPEIVADALRERFLAWARSPDNDRAPGQTCLSACAALAEGLRWQRASVVGSKGCGANMRVTPVGLLPGVDDDTRAGLAQLQAAMTHGHPTALAAAELTAYAVALLARAGTALDDLPARLRERARDQRTTYRADWLGDLWRQSGASTAEDFIARGWDECLAALDRLQTALRAPDHGADPCLATGAGWVAEEALATSLWCALRHRDDPVAALGRAATTSGDSDSIGCLTGAYLGAAWGLRAWPDGWQERIEYADQLHAIGGVWD